MAAEGKHRTSGQGRSAYIPFEPPEAVLHKGISQVDFSTLLSGSHE